MNRAYKIASFCLEPDQGAQTSISEIIMGKKIYIMNAVLWTLYTILLTWNVKCVHCNGGMNIMNATNDFLTGIKNETCNLYCQS